MEQKKFAPNELWVRLDQCLGYASFGMAQVSLCLEFVLVFVVVAAIVCRDVLHISVIWSEEIPVLFNVALVFLGAAYVLRIGGHVRVDMIIERFPKRQRLKMFAISSLPIVIYSGMVGFEGIKITIRAISQHSATESLLATPMWAYYSAITIGMWMLCLEGLFEGVRSLLKLREEQ
jgi:TRAP-type C4-dicarboxylate transport system permease small subunit